MTFTSSNMYHRAYRIGDILDIQMKNGVVYSNCIYSHVSKRNENTVVLVYDDILLHIKRHQINDVALIKKSPFRKRNLYRKTIKKSLHLN